MERGRGKEVLPVARIALGQVADHDPPLADQPRKATGATDAQLRVHPRNLTVRRAAGRAVGLLLSRRGLLA